MLIYQELRRSMAINEFSLEGAVVGFGPWSSRVLTYCYSSVCRDVRVDERPDAEKYCETEVP